MTNGLHADLVLEGGGVKGIALAGAVAVLLEHGYAIHKVGGTSAGAVVGSLVAAGYDGGQLHDLMASVDYRQFQDPPLLGRFGVLGMAGEVLAHKGWCKGDALRGWLTEHLGARGVHVFEDLALDDPGADPRLQQDPDRAFRFVAMASDLTHGRLVRLPWDTRSAFGGVPGETSVAEAVHASAAIPFFYRPARCPSVTDGGEAWLVDGGMLSNFPVGVFDRRDGREPRWPTFGIKLSAKGAEPVNRVTGLLSLGKAMITTMTGFHDRMYVDDPAVQARTIFVDTGTVRATDFGLQRDQAEELYERGRDAAEAFLATWDFDVYKRTYRQPAVSDALQPA
jgi:NTE family protein